MDVLHINAYDSKGGAARAAYRIHKSLLKYENEFEISSKMRVMNKNGDDLTVIAGPPKGSFWIWNYMFPYLNKIPRIGFNNNKNDIHSVSLVSSGLGKELNMRYKNNEQEIINLYWLGELTISISEIGKIKQPLVWTLFDQWAFSGAEHYENIYSKNAKDHKNRYIDGYFRKNRPKYEKGFDINRIMWKEKKNCFKKPINIVCISNWLAECAKKSSLMKNWPIEVIPVPIDIQKYIPINKLLARRILNLPQDKPLLLFGAIGGIEDKRKGFDLLFKSLKILKEKVCEDEYLSNIELIIFGGSDKQNLDENIFPIHFMGHLFDDISLSIIYSAADLFIVPSRLEALGQTAIEAHACGTPVVAFKNGGLIDVIEDKKTGSLADPFNAYSLASEIKWVLKEKSRNIELGKKARKRAEQLWSEERVAKLYRNLYQNIISSSK